MAVGKPVPLPMAIADCGLGADALQEQLGRYRRLGARATGITRRERELVVSFDAGVDLQLLQEAVAVERECCAFFALAYDADAARLSIAVAERERVPALEAIQSALVAGSPP